MKMKPYVALLLAVVVIVLGAKLPEIVGYWQDRGTNDNVAFADVSEVYLEFTKEDMTMKEKLAILAHSTETVEIPQDLASLSEKEILSLAELAAEKYMNASLIPYQVDVQNHLLMAQPVLYYGENGHTNIFWWVNLGDISADWTLNLTIDDHTGKICHVNFQDYEERENSLYDDYKSYENKNDALMQLSAIALEELGDEFSEYEPANLAVTAKTSEDTRGYGELISSELQWEGKTYGKCRMLFVIREDGFYTNVY